MSALQDIKNRLKDLQADTQELDLSEINIGKITVDIKKQLEKFKQVTYLILQGCNLESLENLPNWKLNVIEVSENKLTDSVIPIFAAIPTLHQISCSGNQISSLDALKPLIELKQLGEVDFSQNPVAEKADYRSWFFENIPSLEIVDNMDKEGNVVEEEEEFEEGEGSDEEEWDEDEDEEFSEPSEQSSEKPKKKKK